MPDPIDLHYWPTPNGWKVTIALEEMDLPYTLHLVDIGKGDQFDPDFLKLSPNNRMPAIIDPDGPDGHPISIFESGAILQYLGRKTGKFYGSTDRDRIVTDQWLMWQMGGVGPMAGQAHHFLRYAPERTPPQVLPYAQDRYRNEVGRLYSVLNTRLQDNQFVAGDYSIADMAIWPWAQNWEGQNRPSMTSPTLRAGWTRWEAAPLSSGARRSRRRCATVCSRPRKRRRQTGFSLSRKGDVLRIRADLLAQSSLFGGTRDGPGTSPERTRLFRPVRLFLDKAVPQGEHLEPDEQEQRDRKPERLDLDPGIRGHRSPDDLVGQCQSGEEARQPSGELHPALVRQGQELGPWPRQDTTCLARARSRECRKEPRRPGSS